MKIKIEVTDEFNAEAEEVAEFTRELVYLTDARITALFKKAKENGWYTGHDTVVQGLLFDFCKNSRTRGSWSDYCSTSRLRPAENVPWKEHTS